MTKISLTQALSEDPACDYSQPTTSRQTEPSTDINDPARITLAAEALELYNAVKILENIVCKNNLLFKNCTQKKVTLEIAEVERNINTRKYCESSDSLIHLMDQYFQKQGLTLDELIKIREYAKHITP